MNERTFELTGITANEFWGPQDVHLETLKQLYPKLKLVARGSLLKTYGENEILDEFELRFERLIKYFIKFNKIDDNVIERIVMDNGPQVMNPSDKILVHGVGGKMIKALTPNQQKLVNLVEKNDMVFAIGPAGTGKTYTGVALAVKALKEKRESIISNQIGRSGTSIGANIREAQYAHGKADFIAKLQIALKEANETGYWLELLYKTNYISESEYKALDSACTSMRVMLISSINTAKEKPNQP